MRALPISKNLGFLLRLGLEKCHTSVRTRVALLGLDYLQCSILTLLDLNGGKMEQSELEGHLQVPYSNLLTVAIDLQDRGMLCRTWHPDHHTSLELTELGRSMAFAAVGLEASSYSDLTSTMNESEVQELLRLLMVFNGIEEAEQPKKQIHRPPIQFKQRIG